MTCIIYCNIIQYDKNINIYIYDYISPIRPSRPNFAMYLELPVYLWMSYPPRLPGKPCATSPPSPDPTPQAEILPSAL